MNKPTVTQPQIHQPSSFELRELVAQETMADAALWMLFATILTIFVTALGTLLIWKQVRLTRRAVEDTGQATEAMRAANSIAAESMRRELRAYLTVEPGGVNEARDGFARLPLRIENRGQTPAFDVMLFANHAVAESPRDITLKDLGTPLAGEINDAAMGPSVCRWMFSYASEDLLKPFLVDIRDRRRAIIQFGYVTYKDAFGDVWQTNFAFYHWGEELSAESALRCRFGNAST